MTSTPEYKQFTFTYDPIHRVDLDIYIPLSSSVDEANKGPIESLSGMISFHGGGFTSGSKKDVYFPTWLLERCIKRKIIFVSPNYRLFHPSTGADILKDVETLFTYLSSESSELRATLGELGYSLNLTKLGVIGFSAGEYLARAATVLPTIPKEIKPKVMVGFYGLSGNFLLDHWIKTKSENQLLPGVPYNHEKVNELFNRVPEEPISDVTLSFDFNSEPAHRFGLFSLFYNQGTLVDHLLDQPGLSESLENIPVENRLEHIPEEKKYLLLPFAKDIQPKIMLVHGENDLIVPVEASKAFKKNLDNLGNTNAKHIWVKNAGHGLLDINNFPNFVPTIQDVYGEVFEFITNAF